jgi:excisionase family DNA binding protein
LSKRLQKPVGKAAAQSPKTPEAVKEPAPSGRVEILLNGVRVAVSPELEAAVHRAYNGLCQPLPTEMTTTQAAAFLDVSRPFVIKLVKQGELPCRMVGKHRRIPTAALQEYREKMFQQARRATDEMAQLSQELGLYGLEGPPPKVP